MDDKMKEFLRNNPRFVNQFRSWNIMSRYFGIQEPGRLAPFKVKWPEHIEKHINNLVAESNKRWEEYAKKN